MRQSYISKEDYELPDSPTLRPSQSQREQIESKLY